MAPSSFSFKGVNKILLLLTIASLVYKRGHFSGTLVPSPFQVLFVISLLLTIVYVLKESSITEFFKALPRKMVLACASLFLSVLLGWAIGSVVVGIPTTISTIQDFGTFTMSLIIFFLVLFYTKDDERYASWCLYALLIPSVYPFYYFFTHGFVGYWGVLNDNSLNGVIDPNMLSKTLLIPVLFFIGTSLFALKGKRWLLAAGYVIIASLYAMLIFWTASRGSAVGLIAGAALLWIVFSARAFTWKKLAWSAGAIAIIISLGFAMIPFGVKQEIYAKITSTGKLPHSADGSILNITTVPTVTLNDLRETPRTDVRIFEWVYFLKYAAYHPLGVGPSASSVDYQRKGGDYLQLRPGNTYIQVWLWGGILAFVGFLYVVRGAFVAVWTRWKRTSDQHSFALLGILLALSIAIIFDASLYFYWYFIILALAVQKGKNENGTVS